MKHSFLMFAILLTFATPATCQTTITGSFVHGGINRSYSFYVPASYVPGQAVPLVFGLHGTSSDGANFAQHRDFRPIADTANFIVVNPDGSTMLGIRFWNYGNVFGSTVDDVGFLEALIDTIAADYSVDQNRVYSAGMSNGSFMSYCLACESDRFAAIAGVTGSMSVNMYNSCNPANPIPTLHIHGTEDPTNPYGGTSTMKAVEDVSLFWVNQNNCNPNPVVTAVPNTNTSDGATAEHYLYTNGTNGHSVEFFKIIGGEHSWPGSPMPGSSDVTCMDFEATKEIWRFFRQFERSGTNSVGQPDQHDFKIWPNPAKEEIYFQTGNQNISNVTITDVQGRKIRNISGENIHFISVSDLDCGNYLLHVSGTDFEIMRKITVAD